MNKRVFLKLVSAALSTPVLSPLLACAAQDKLRNWAGNVIYGTENLYSAISLEQAQDFVRKHTRMKVLGTRHCFNHIANSTENFLSLRSMAQAPILDAKARTVTIPANMSYGQLSPYRITDLPCTIWHPCRTSRLPAPVAPPRTDRERRTVIFPRQCRRSK
jgi:xylitol oxidase